MRSIRVLTTARPMPWSETSPVVLPRRKRSKIESRSSTGTLVCKAVGQPRFWWSRDAINRAELYRRCTENLRLEAQAYFSKSAHQLGRRDYCAEERALLARDQINQP